jgi:hypothetical protein
MKLWSEKKKGLTFFLKSLRSYKAFAAHILSQLFPEAATPASACKSLLQTSARRLQQQSFTARSKALTRKLQTP